MFQSCYCYYRIRSIQLNQALEDFCVCYSYDDKQATYLTLTYIFVFISKTTDTAEIISTEESLNRLTSLA